MKIIEPSFEIIGEVDGVRILKDIELIGRVCYQSEWATKEDSYLAFVKMVIERGHESVIEHRSVSVSFVCDRGVSHELVRHRLCAFSQESTRYCNYSKDKFGNEITVIKPLFWGGCQCEREEACPKCIAYSLWAMAMADTESAYFDLLKHGATAQEARSVLPNSLKTQIVVTANLREWRHIFKLRTSKAAHPQMRQIMVPLLAKMKELVPVVFDDIGV